MNAEPQDSQHTTTQAQENPQLFKDKEESEHYVKYYEKFDILPAAKLASISNIHKAETVVDIGCGTGGLSLFYLKNLPNLKQLFSVDISKCMIDIAKDRKQKAEGISPKIKHQFEVGDAQDLKTIDSGVVDVAVMNYVIDHIPDPVKGVKEAWRVLKPGGQLILGDFWAMEDPDGFYSLFDKIVSELGLNGKEPSAYGEDSLTPDNKVQKKPYIDIKEDRFCQLLRENGFEIELHYVDQIYYPLNLEEVFEPMLMNAAWNLETIKSFSEEQRKKVLERAKQIIEERKKKAMPFSSEFLGIIAKKI